MHYHALLIITAQVSVSVYSATSTAFQAALSSPFTPNMLLYHTNLQLSENMTMLLLLLIVGLF